jgi:hypothetical protein
MPKQTLVWTQRMVLVAATTLAGCGGVSYFRQVGESGEQEPAESISFEARDYSELARLFADELKKSPLYQTLRASGSGDQPPAIAHKAFTVELSDLNTKPEVMEQRIRSELQQAGVRYISEQDRASMIESLKLQNSDLNDPATRGQFGKFANAKFYLVGKLYQVEHYIQKNSKKREFHLFVDLLTVETLESVFTGDVVVVKYMQG